MFKWHYKGCPRCHGGDMLVENDLIDGWVDKCIQCGYTHRLPTLQKEESVTYDGSNRQVRTTSDSY